MFYLIQIKAVLYCTMLLDLPDTHIIRGTEKSLARPISRYILFMVRIFRLMLVLLYIYIVLIFLEL